MTSDPYDILGVGKDATPDEINAAYKAAAKKSHPDSGGSSEKFTRVKQASMVLLDPKRRKQFDDTGTLDDGKADNTEAQVMEMIANFFISTINTIEEGFGPNLEQSDLVGNARKFFAEKITFSQNNILNITKQIKKFERALKRLKSKRKKDIINIMLTRHVKLLENAIENNKLEIGMHQRVLAVLNDYEFDFAPLQTAGNAYYQPKGFIRLPPGFK